MATAAAPLACGDDDGGADGSLARCVAPDESTPPELGPSRSGIAIVFDEPGAEPGVPLAFHWEISDEQWLVGDETLVECWDGEAWTTAWYAVGMYGPDHEPRAIVDPPVDLTFTSDGFGIRVGRVAVPEEAPPGTYRIVESIGIDDLRTGTMRNENIEARFVIE